MSSITYEDLVKAWKLVKELGPDPLEEWMKLQGFDPKKGARIVMAPGALEFGPYGPPYYVDVSPLLRKGTVCLVSGDFLGGPET